MEENFPGVGPSSPLDFLYCGIRLPKKYASNARNIDMYPQYWTPGMGAYHFRLSLFVFDEVAENADLEVVTE